MPETAYATDHIDAAPTARDHPNGTPPPNSRHPARNRTLHHRLPLRPRPSLPPNQAGAHHLAPPPLARSRAARLRLPRPRQAQLDKPAGCTGGRSTPSPTGRSSSAAAETKEPFAWALSNDNRSILGADMDGYFRITLLTPDQMEKCYTHNATGPSRSVVATCYLMERVRR